MKYLLDTHIFLWWVSDHPKLSKNAEEVISNPFNEIFLSAASQHMGDDDKIRHWQASIAESA